MSDGAVNLARTRNLLLAGLPPAEKVALQPLLKRFDIKPRISLEGRNRPIEMVHFIESGFFSVIASTSGDRQVEVGIIGREGMSGIPLVLGSRQSPNTSIVQMPGRSLAIESDGLVRLMNERPALHHRLDLFVQSFMIQISQTTLANSKANVDHRLARWLLMARDRADGDAIPLTHEFLSIMLGVRRAAVTVALHQLEAEQFIRATRGLVTIRNYRGLRQYADGIYGVAESEYERLLGFSIIRDDAVIERR